MDGLFWKQTFGDKSLIDTIKISNKRFCHHQLRTAGRGITTSRLFKATEQNRRLSVLSIDITAEVRQF